MDETEAVKIARAHCQASGCDCEPEITVDEMRATVAHDETCAHLLHLQVEHEPRISLYKRLS